MGVDVEVLSAVHHTPGGNEPNQPETMVSVEVRDEDGVQSSGAEHHLAHGDLCAFAAVNQKLLVTHLQYLRRGVVAYCRNGAAAT